MKKTITLTIAGVIFALVFAIWANWFYRTREVTSGLRPVNAFDLYSVSDKLVDALDRNTAAIVAQALENEND